MPTSPNAPVVAGEPLLGPERFDCYHIAPEFNVLAERLAPRSHRDIQDQLICASLSISTNMAEGCG